MMYKVLIIDDEKIVRIALKSIISWESLGFYICDTASNAQMALSMIEKHKPNVVITDIEMPSMNGIDLIKQAKSIGYNGEWIILTNHENFCYAKEAITLNVFDYIIKTDISKEIIKNLLLKVKDKFDTLNINGNEIEESILKKDAILLKDNITKDEFYFDKSYLLFFIFLEQGFKARKANLVNIINETIKDYSDGLIELNPQSVVLLIGKDKYFEFYEDLDNTITKINSMINLYMNSNCCFFTSNIIDSQTNIIPIIKQANLARKYSFYLGYGKVFPLKQFKELSTVKLSFYNEYRELIFYINQYEFESAVNIVNKWFDNIKVSCPRVEDVIILTNRIEKLLYVDYKPYLSELKNNSPVKNNTADKIKNSVIKIIREIEKHKINFNTDLYREEVREIVKYISENINSKFSLNLLANNVGLTESYLSRLFKLETNINLIHYINIQKLEKAKEQLLVKNCSVKNLSYELGGSVISSV